MRVKSPFSQSALFGFIGVSLIAKNADASKGRSGRQPRDDDAAGPRCHGAPAALRCCVFRTLPRSFDATHCSDGRRAGALRGLRRTCPGCATDGRDDVDVDRQLVLQDRRQADRDGRLHHARSREPVRRRRRCSRRTCTPTPRGRTASTCQRSRKVRNAMLGTDKLDLLLVGHAHWDHSWDTPAWSRLTGAPMIGSLSACLQANAQGVTGAAAASSAAARRSTLGDGVTMRVVRWNHSGDAPTRSSTSRASCTGRRCPTPRPAGCAPASARTIRTAAAIARFSSPSIRPRASSRSSSTTRRARSTSTRTCVVDGVSYGSPLGNLAAAMKDAGLTQVDAWIGDRRRAGGEDGRAGDPSEGLRAEPLGRPLQSVLARHAVSVQGRRAAQLPRGAEDPAAARRRSTSTSSC